MAGAHGIGNDTGETGSVQLNPDTLYIDYGSIATGSGGIAGAIIKFVGEQLANNAKIVLYEIDTNPGAVLAYSDVFTPQNDSTMEVDFITPYMGVVVGQGYAFGIIGDDYMTVASISGGNMEGYAQLFGDAFPDSPVGGNWRGNDLILYAVAASGGPVISAGTPQGITTDSPVLGFTSSVTSGTARIVVDTAANMADITEGEVLAGQNSNGVAALRDSGDIAISGPAVSTNAITGLAPAAYTVAAAIAGSNVLTWQILVRHTNFEVVQIGTPNTTAANRLTAVPDIAAGDYIEWGNIQGTGTVVVNDDGTFDADAGVSAFDIYVGNVDGWGAIATQQVSAADVTAPEFSAGPGVTNLQPTSLNVTFTADEGGDYRIVIVPSNATAPTGPEILAGTASGGAAPTAASALFSMTAGAAISTPFTGLTAGQNVIAYVALRDAAPNTRIGNTGTITMPSAPDNTDPTISISVASVGAAHVITAAVADNVGVSSVVFYRGATVLGTRNSAPWTWTWDSTGFAAGNYTLTAVAADAAGNTTTSNSALVQINDPGEPVPEPARGGRGTYEQRGAVWVRVEDGG